MIEGFNGNYITGWIKVFRSLSNKGWYKKSDFVHLWIHLLIKASHKGIEFMFNGDNVNLKAGQFITGRKKLSEETGINESKIERILNFFEKNEHQIEQQKTTKNRLISILNWDLYQVNEQQNEQQLNSKRTTNEQQVNTIKNVKNNKELKNDKEYKKVLLSEINSDDYPNLNFEYIEIAKSYQKLFIKNQNDAGIENSILEKAKGIWVDDIRLLIEIDKKTKEQCKYVWDFLSTNEFWKSNILSTKKLREKFDTLLIQSKNKGNGKQNSTLKQEILDRMEKRCRNITES